MDEFFQQGAKLDKGWSYRGENFVTTFDMQVELAKRFYGLPKNSDKKELNDVVFRWVDQNDSSNSRKFRVFVEANPEVVDLFKRDPEVALSRIEEAIYEKHHS